MTGDVEAATRSSDNKQTGDPFAELATSHREELERLATSELPAAWVAQAILDAHTRGDA